MHDVNHYAASGKLIKEPEVRETPSGIAVCDLLIIVNSNKSKNKKIQGKVPPIILPITLWDCSAEYWGDILQKNDWILATGELVDNNFEKPNDKDNNKYRTKGRLKLNNPQITILSKGEQVKEAPPVTVPTATI